MSKIMAGGGIGILPRDIDATQHFWAAFRHVETEISAGWLVRFAQERGTGWEPFTREDIEAFYGRKHNDGFTFNRLISGGWIVQDTEDRYHFTDDFVRRCHDASPAKAPPQQEEQ